MGRVVTSAAEKPEPVSSSSRVVISLAIVRLDRARSELLKGEGKSKRPPRAMQYNPMADGFYSHLLMVC